ncbi:MAG TPA: FHA domain-containing protein [Vicinamibacteria bacterium]|jgi:DNA-binding winged helix-turn-helix (wHTH) protein
MRVSFAEYVFDSDTRELRRRGEAVRLSPKAFQLLEALLRERPKALSKSEIHDRLWPETHVSGSSLGRLVAEIRAALEDPADSPALVRTVHGFGYAFCGAATEAGAGSPEGSGPALVYRLLWGAREIELGAGANVLGREPGCAVWVDAPGVSRRHARITVTDAKAVLEDMGSKNGTYLRGRKLERAAALADGDPIALGTALMTIRVLRQGGSTDTVPPPPTKA